MMQLSRPPSGTRVRLTALTAVAAASALLLSACSSSSKSSASSPAASAGASSAGGTSAAATSGGGSTNKSFKVCMATGGQGLDWQKGQGDVARALAKQRGWGYVELSNNGDGPTANKNADVFIQDKCSAVIEFNGQPSVNGVIAAKLKAAKIPAITYDIGQKGWYFVGIDNLKAGVAGGKALGEIAKTKWNCDPDLVLSAEGKAAGIVNTQRTGGMRTGLKSVCPNIAASKYISFESNGLASVGQPAARAVLAAHTSAKKILVVGLNDGGVLGALQAAQQLNRASDIVGWGQDGSFITGKNVNPHLAGSVFYFLEGYAVYAFTGVLDKIAAGSPPPVGDDTSNNPTILIPPCPVSAAQASKIPTLTTRVAKLLAAPKGTTENSLYCPKS
jgi:ABC-type sugar transport system substrate-binding protein